MSFFEVASSFLEKDFAQVGNKFVPQLLRTGLAQGLSGNEMLGALRELGMPIGTQRFFGLLGEIRATQAMHESQGGASSFSIPEEGEFAPWTTSRSSGYLYQIRAYFQSHDPVTGELVRIFKPFDVRSNSIISRYEALAQAMDYVPLGGNTGSNHTLVGLEIVGLFKMIAGRA